MGATHKAITDFIAARDLRFVHVSWEVYGHWTPDPADMTTDIYYLLGSSPASGGGAELCPNK